ncbi:B3 domain-containing protein Os01g0905400-like [Actinidia eriantha]|uniref:B3 domain-containing protein Os01g0905400-like n=1 Tax=Actinidia eriantha TaxID=165200 RepID=UPI002586291C|nr:B3 domain-containing protein Os01g0905400-like [Actinidia eriantha]XP_057459988.1 B3 domain-containing protein Os01g0905400-like [Actinidia eriantha]
MGCPSAACAECTQNCLLIHGKNKDPSSIVTSFFKVMIGDNFSKVLFLPPKIAQTMLHLIDQKIQLEDARGERWMVTLSKCNGSLAFEEGWHAFSHEHGLEVGDFTLFHYIMGSHFVVQIYGKNGCERLIFSDENISRKKRRTNRKCSAKAGRHLSIDSDSMNKQGSTTSAVSGSNVEISRSQPMATDNALNIANYNERLQHPSRTIYTEEPFYMIDGDARNRQEDHRNSLYDLSYFEIKSTSGVHETNRVLEHEMSPCQGKKKPKSQAGLDIVDKVPVTEDVVSSLRLPDVPNMTTLGRNEDSQTIENVMPISQKISDNGNSLRQEQTKKKQTSNDQALISQKEDNLLKHSSQSASPKCGGVPKFSGLLASVRTQNCQSGKRMNVVKAEQVEMNKVACNLRETVNGSYPEIKEFGQSFNYDKAEVCKVVKTEPVDTFELSPADAVNISFLMAPDEQDFVELPACLASVSFKGGLRMQRKVVVILRDPVSRLWPVIYQEKYGLKVLTSGWAAFVKANSIRPGDECVFKVENGFECIYRVDIVRK